MYHTVSFLIHVLPPCHQELVNLLVCGHAVPNVFDNDIELDSGHGNVTLLKGIKSHCDVGLLSLFEHYNICKVRNGKHRVLHQKACSECEGSTHFLILCVWWLLCVFT